MGIAHSWWRPVKMDLPKFRKAVRHIAKLMPALQERMDLTGIEGHPNPTVGDYGVYFAKRGMPWFVVPRVYVDERPGRPQGPEAFGFVKTYGAQDYDLAVMSCLLVFKHHFGAEFRVASDLPISGWTRAIQFVNQKLSIKDDWEFRETTMDGLPQDLLERKEPAHGRA